MKDKKVIASCLHFLRKGNSNTTLDLNNMIP